MEEETTEGVQPLAVKIEEAAAVHVDFKCELIANNRRMSEPEVLQ